MATRRSITANGGLVLLREKARALGLAEVIAAPLPNPRNQLYVRTYAAMETSRKMAMAAGHGDGDDLDELRHDPRDVFSRSRQDRGALLLPRIASV